MAGNDVIRVVCRVEDAKHIQMLDLSDCLLQAVPDAIFLMLRHATIIRCTFARNTIRKIPSKLGQTFSNLRALDLSNNKLVTLPDELDGITDLLELDISRNSFAMLPNVVYNLSKLRSINAEENIITDVNVNKLTNMQAIVDINLQKNPIYRDVFNQLKDITSITVLLTHQPELNIDDLD